MSTDQPATAKLVDLDTEQQMVSQICGLQIKVAISDTDWFMGDFRVTWGMTPIREKLGHLAL